MYPQLFPQALVSGIHGLQLTLLDIVHSLEAACLPHPYLVQLLLTALQHRVHSQSALLRVLGMHQACFGYSVLDLEN